MFLAPVPDDLAHANPAEHAGAFVGAAPEGVMGDQMACRHVVSLAPVRNRGLGRGDNARWQCHSETPSARMCEFHDRPGSQPWKGMCPQWGKFTEWLLSAVLWHVSRRA